MDYKFINPGYTIAFQDYQVLLEKNDRKLKQICAHCLLVSQYFLFFKSKHVTCFSCRREYRKHIFILKKILPCLICKQFFCLDEIYLFKV